jgi:hypothetical protein
MVEKARAVFSTRRKKTPKRDMNNYGVDADV